MSTLRTDNIRTLDDTLNIPLTNIALKTDLIASTIAVTPTGGISQTNVQAALAGLDTRVTARQPLDATLTALAGVTTSANTLIYATGADAFTTTVLTPFARTLLDDTDAASARTTLGTTALLQGTSQATTSGTAIDFTGIPTGVKRVTIIFNTVSTNGAASYLLQIGAGSVEVTGYSSLSNRLSTGGTVATTYTTGFGLLYAANTEVASGSITLYNLSGNIWIASGVTGSVASSQSVLTSGTKTLAGVLDRVRLTTSNGTDLFDAGSVNIIYEG